MAHLGGLSMLQLPGGADGPRTSRITDPSRQVIVRRRLVAAPGNTPVQFRVSYVPAELAEGTPVAQSAAIPDAWPAALTTYLGRQVRLASSQVTARHPNHEEAAALALPSDAAVLVREDIYQDRRGSPVDFTRTVWRLRAGLSTVIGTGPGRAGQDLGLSEERAEHVLAGGAGFGLEA